MSGLTNIEKTKLERILGMGGGYVVGFTNRSFQEFFRDAIHTDIYAPEYGGAGESKARRMREFWRRSSDFQVAAVLNTLVDGWSEYAGGTELTPADRQTLREIIARLDPRRAAPKPTAKSDQHLAMDFPKFRDELKRISLLTPQQRGYAFEKFLVQLFEANDLKPREPFRNKGEQIDGSFALHNEIYLLEAKWENSPTGVADLRAFQGKVEAKASWTRGLFVSIAGFTPEGLAAFGQAKRFVCMNGLDLDEMLAQKISLGDVLDWKVRLAAESGSPFTPVREMFL